jgi:hypothetical protein
MNVWRPWISLDFFPDQALALDEENDSNGRIRGIDLVVADFRIDGYDTPREGGMISYGSLSER